MTIGLIITPLGDCGVLVRFPEGRPYEIYRAFRRAFPKARPKENWTWHVRGRTAGRRLSVWQEREAARVVEEARRRRREAEDREWEAAAP